MLQGLAAKYYKSKGLFAVQFLSKFLKFQHNKQHSSELQNYKVEFQTLITLNMEQYAHE